MTVTKRVKGVYEKIESVRFTMLTYSLFPGLPEKIVKMGMEKALTTLNCDQCSKKASCPHPSSRRIQDREEKIETLFSCVEVCYPRELEELLSPEEIVSILR